MIKSKLTLSDRQRAVLNLMAKGCENKEIGDELHLSVTTIKDYVKSIMVTLQAKNRTQAVAIGITKGLVHMDIQEVKLSSGIRVQYYPERDQFYVPHFGWLDGEAVEVMQNTRKNPSTEQNVLKAITHVVRPDSAEPTQVIWCDRKHKHYRILRTVKLCPGCLTDLTVAK
jgi:DNA-binding CsgD family transcriptional regulator